MRPETFRCLVPILEGRQVHHPEHGLISSYERQRDRVQREALDEVHGAVDRVEGPDQVLPFPAPAFLLTEKADVGGGLREVIPYPLLDLVVEVGGVVPFPP